MTKIKLRVKYHRGIQKLGKRTYRDRKFMYKEHLRKSLGHPKFYQLSYIRFQTIACTPHIDTLSFLKPSKIATFFYQLIKMGIKMLDYLNNFLLKF